MELSPEEKAKIYAEEKARIDARIELESNAVNKNGSQTSPVAKGCLYLILVLGALAVVGTNIESCNTKKAEEVQNEEASKFIKYQVLNEWPSGLEVLVDEKEKKADVMALGNHLASQHMVEPGYIVRIYDDINAWGSIRDDRIKYSEAKFYRHALYFFDRNNVDKNVVTWKGVGRDH